MSKSINVNPGQYYVAGRERMGENMTQDQEKQSFGQQKARQRKGASQRPAPQKRRRSK